MIVRTSQLMVVALLKFAGSTGVMGSRGEKSMRQANGAPIPISLDTVASRLILPRTLQVLRNTIHYILIDSAKKSSLQKDACALERWNVM